MTLSEKVTVQCTDEAFVGLVSLRLMDETVGGVSSMVNVWPTPGVSTFVALSVALDFTV